MRLDKFIGNNSTLSRAQIHIALKQSLITVDGIIAKKANLHVEPGNRIICNEQVIEERKIRYLMLHKPTGYVCANSDSEHPTVLDLLELPFKHELQIVGRLDVDTTGLVLLTDDGQWNHKITSPKHSHTKSYLVTTANHIDATTKAIFATGLMLNGETKMTLPAELEIIDTHQARLSICEGKYHQVKRMFATVGNRVVALHRERIGNITLDSNLASGKYRHLTAAEIASFEK